MGGTWMDCHENDSLPFMCDTFAQPLQNHRYLCLVRRDDPIVNNNDDNDSCEPVTFLIESSRVVHRFSVDGKMKQYSGRNAMMLTWIHHSRVSCRGEIWCC